MDISVRTEEYVIENRSWLGSADGTEFTQTVTLDVSAFSRTVHYPEGFIPSGTVLAKITATGLYGPYAGNASEAQKVTITGAPTGGDFTLTFSGSTTAAIAYNATAATVQAELVKLANVRAGDVTVTGGPGPGAAYVVTFGGQYVGLDVPQMTATAALTGGSSPAVAVTTTTVGGSTATSGLQTAEGFLFNNTQVRAGGPNVGAPLHWRGVIRSARLPANSGLDGAARTALAAKFRFQ